MRINARNQESIKINGEDIENVEEFTYLGAIVCKEGGTNRTAADDSLIIL